VEQVNAAPGEITLVPVGPFTNIGEALALDPDLPEKVAEIVLMGGCVGWPEGALSADSPGVQHRHRHTGLTGDANLAARQ
jgi:inosine-uridine nucleoside N-ribohydrolase